MKKTGRKLVAFLAIFIILLTTSSQSAIAKEWDLKFSDDISKVWEVRFNKPLDESTLTANNVYVLDGKQTHATTLKLMGDGSVLQVSPSVPYEVGKPYMLMITGDVKSSDKKALKTSVELPFQIVNSEGIIQAVYSTSNGIFTTITVMASSDVNRVTVGSVEMTYRGKNRHTTTLLDAKPGSTVSISAYDESNKRLETKKITLESASQF